MCTAVYINNSDVMNKARLWGKSMKNPSQINLISEEQTNMAILWEAEIVSK